MKQLKLLLNTGLFLGIGILLNAQNMNVVPNTGSTVSYTIANISKLTFGSGNMNVVPKTGATVNHALSTTRKVDFGTSSGGGGGNVCLNTNADFSGGMTGWANWNQTGTSANYAVVNGEMAITAITGTTASWHAQISRNYNFVNGKIYTISFKARSTSSKVVGVLIRECVAGDCSTADKYESITVTPTMTSYTFDYTQIEPTYVYGQLIFEVGVNTSDIYFDDICISEKTLSNEEIELKNNFSYYPNPVTTTFNMNVPQAGNVDIISLDGKVLISAKVNASETNSINVENLSSGIYLCRYTNNTEVKTIKLVKQ